MQADISRDRPIGWIWRRAGAGAALAVALAVLAGMTSPAPPAAAWAPQVQEAAAPSILAPPPVRWPSSRHAASAPLTALDRGDDDLAQVYRALSDGG